jgi:pantoate--beta-alanine ligase
MQITADVPQLRAWIAARRSAGDRIALVPTMGYFHDGHLALIDEARRQAGCVVVSSFVNPLQFGPGEDLDQYPRDDERDRQLAEGRGVDFMFRPDVGVMYPPGSEIHVVPGAAGAEWEGTFRPGHFEGVLTVVAKLFHLVDPDVACFGQKDVQQAALIRQMVRDLNWNIDIVVVPTVRESDGLALSSRNVYLSDAGRQQALGLSGALTEAHLAWQAGERTAAGIKERMQSHLSAIEGLKVEYIAVVDPARFQSVEAVDEETVVALAGRIGRTRLIDNIVLGRGIG